MSYMNPDRTTARALFHTMMKPASYPLVDEAAQRHHPTAEGVPWGVLLGIGIRLDPQAITY
jgi:hypothetical protein